MGSDTPEKELTAARKAAFTLVALAIPVLFFVLAEAILRLAGVGAEYPLFIANPQQPDYQLANPQVIKRFFGDPDDAPSMQIETVYFRTKKPANGLRIFVQGGSSAAGFPYGFGASLTGMLEQRLRRSFPEREIEVVNTAMSAVNSYTLLDFADEIIEQQPDAVLVYAGHNEYLGILGVGSNFLGGQSPAATRVYLKLRRLRLFQLLQGAFAGLAPGDAETTRRAARGGGGTMMSRVAAEQHIRYGSPLFDAGVSQFRHNLKALVQRYQEAGVPVYVGTLVSNEKGQPPFNSGLHPATDREQWHALYQSAQSEGTVAAAKALLALDDSSADALFLLGEAAWDAGEYDAARRAFQAARDHDELRFRAPGVFNDIIREAGARVVEAEDAVRVAAAHGIFDTDLVLEHVHPSLRGYFLLADAYYDALVADGVAGTATAAVDDEQAWLEVPVSEVDRIFSEYKIARITSHWPFSNAGKEPPLPPPDGVPAMLAQQLYRQTLDWAGVHKRLAAHYKSIGDSQAYAKIVLILADAFPFDAPALYHAGVALLELGRNRQALDYLHRSARRAPDELNALLAYSHALLLNGAPQQARQVLQRVLAIDPDNATALQALQQIDGS